MLMKCTRSNLVNAFAGCNCTLLHAIERKRTGVDKVAPLLVQGAIVKVAILHIMCSLSDRLLLVITYWYRFTFFLRLSEIVFFYCGNFYVITSLERCQLQPNLSPGLNDQNQTQSLNTLKSKPTRDTIK